MTGILLAHPWAFGSGELKTNDKFTHKIMHICSYESKWPSRDKTCLRVSDTVRLKSVSSATETSKKIEISLVASLDMIPPIKRITNLGPDQSAWMRMLVSAFVVHNPRRQIFPHSNI